MHIPVLSAAYWLCLLAASPTEAPDFWLDFLTRGGLLGGSLLIIYALLTDRLISGPRHRRELRALELEVAIWRAAALRSTEGLERVSIALEQGTLQGS